MFNEISLPQGWRRNRGLEERMVRPLCLEHVLLSAFIDVAPPECTEGDYECPPNAVAIAKLYLPHDRLEGYTCREQRPVYDSLTVKRALRGFAVKVKL